MKDNFKTEVIFRKFKEGDIIALFPYDVDFSGFCGSYMHIGQHSMATYDLINCTKLAQRDEYKDLFTELESIGYNLKVIQRRNTNNIKGIIPQIELQVISKKS